MSDRYPIDRPRYSGPIACVLASALAVASAWCSEPKAPAVVTIERLASAKCGSRNEGKEMKPTPWIWALAAAALLAGCTDQQRAKTWGGSATIDLPAGSRVVTATWKEDDLWILTRQDASASTAPQTYLLTESSSFGLLNGKVALVEH